MEMLRQGQGVCWFVRAVDVVLGSEVEFPTWDGGTEVVVVTSLELVGDDVTFNGTITTSMGNGVRVKGVPVKEAPRR